MTVYEQVSHKVLKQKQISKLVRFFGITVSVFCCVLFSLATLYKIISDNNFFMKNPAINEIINNSTPELLSYLTLRGQDDKNRPFFVTSDKSYLMKEDYHLENPKIKMCIDADGRKGDFLSNKGVFNSQKLHFELTENVEIKTESGTIMNTEHAFINAKEKHAFGNKPIKVMHLNTTVLYGPSFKYNGSEQKLYVPGPVRIILY